MNFNGQEISKEQLERAQRISSALLAIAKIDAPDELTAITAGLGAFLELAYVNVGYGGVLACVTRLLDTIVEVRPMVERAINGPPLKLVPLSTAAPAVEGPELCLLCGHAKSVCTCKCEIHP